MNVNESPGFARALQSLLLEIARTEEVAAAREAAAVRYWEPCPTSVWVRRSVAALLRERAESLSIVGVG